MLKNRLQFLLNLVLTCAVVFTLYMQFSSRQRIVYVNTNKLLLEYKGMKEAQASFEQLSASWKANIDTLSSELSRSAEKLEQERATLSAKEVHLTEELLRTKQQQLVQYQQATEQKASQEDARLREQVLSKINAYIQEYGKQHNLSIIMGATEMGNIVYADEVMDVTDDIIQGLNKRRQ